MDFARPLVRGTLIKRYRRFFADVALDGGEVVTAHCPNSGSMLSVNTPGAPVWLSPADNPARKLRYTWELIEVDGALVGINTQRPNALVAEAIAAGRIPELAGYNSIRREVTIDHSSRIDIFLEAPGQSPCYVEVKNVTLKRGGTGSGLLEFPDARTERGAKHLFALSGAAQRGERAVMLFLAQRGDGGTVAIARDIDPAYADALRVALAAGVEVLCYGCDVSLTGIDVRGPLSFAPWASSDV